MTYIRAILLLAVGIAIIGAEANARYALEKRGLVTCETVLSPDLCQTFRDLATNLKLTAGVIDDAVRETVRRGITSIPEVITSVRAYLKSLITDKECEDLLSKAICTRIHKITDFLKLSRDVVKGIIQEVVVMGIPTPSKIFNKVMEKVRNLIEKRTCDEFLSGDLCTKLRNIATGLKTDVKLVEKFVKDALVKGYQRKEEIFQAVVDFLRNEVLTLTCDDLINPKMCAFLRAVAQNFKLKKEAVDDAVKEAIMKGKSSVQAIVDFARDFLKERVLNKKCDDLIPSFICEKVRAIAKRFKVRVEIVDAIVKDAIASGKQSIRDIIDFAKEKLKKYIKCENFLGDRLCRTVRNVAKRLGIGRREVEQKLREIIASGKSLVSDIYREIINYIKDKIFG